MAASYPDREAVAFEGARLTYGELNARANRIAHGLMARGVGPDVVVGLCAERSLEMVSGLLGVLKAGGAYLPLDPSLPAERLGYMAADAGAALVLAQGRLAGRLPDGAPIVLLDGADAFADQPSHDPPHRTAPDNLAYVIYTSGSTGQPKGVAMPHRGLSQLLDWHEAVYPGGLRTLQFASFSFDVSIQEMLTCWSAGGALVLIGETEKADLPQLLKRIEVKAIERLFVPFAALQPLAELVASRPSAPSALREIVTAGEQLRLTPALRAWLDRAPDCRLINQYGPTETHVVTSHAVVRHAGDGEALPPIGRPIWNTRLHILDVRMEMVPIGAVGELYIGGAGLARGYAGRSDLTAARFVPDPFSEEGGRLYRTGDLVRHLPDGNLAFVGRADDQVKIRGFRIEPGEIEAALSGLADVAEAVVVAREAGGEKRLVAYVTARSGARLEAATLRVLLGARLPSHMVPSAFVVLDALPLTRNGKVDRRALPEPDGGSLRRAAYVAPRDETEALLCRIWSEALGVERVGVDDNFFELGGDSLLSIKVVSEARKHGIGLDRKSTRLNSSHNPASRMPSSA
jgi:amino acid adenylation domain-containing protein